MKSHPLTLKIPPLALVVIFAVLMFIASALAGGSLELTLYRAVGIGVTLLLACYFCLAGVLAFRKAQTTVNPMSPESSSQLVNTGVYRLSRNPMYVGFVFILICWATYLGHTFLMLFIPAFMLYMNKFQISAEEQALGKIFGQEYQTYMATVRRWL
ncbi:isoprenylcysteine carboxylmethyltransferase family protein [Thalassotalea sp. LPB0316]|uniref:methyltransferase family protein n=1 Tax=Thalassotalea sp. LPB0316 TaxID=2769490 RepID=UPI0018671485|nr:isoprenylcysteine carboxylmethyltransferase family protein [Thalassotalea sp. LPB0316]QOL25829.1 isoprenylcysteine carboxylmethyltransferase family protein [Thalassotalea sp. LPB0316]